MDRFWQQKRFVTATFALIAALILVIYLVAALGAGQGELLVPLDDVYIHFQYAKQLALGQPNVYNPGEAPTSGATSFLYPFVLALGWRLGFQGLLLGLWAMLVGAVALFAALWAVMRLGTTAGIPRWLAFATALIFGLTGSINWHFMSGMETGLMIALTLWLLLAVVEKRLHLFAVVGLLLTLMRPEGGILALLASGTMLLRLWREPEITKSSRWRLLWLLLPPLALGVQPAVNWLITGTSVATGNQAKSILALVPQDWETIAALVLGNFARMWAEFISGYGQEGWYLPPLLGFVGLLTILSLFFRRDWRLVGLMLLGWFLAVTAAISTLDTAFWHFKRYQMPLMALFFPLAAWGVGWLWGKFPRVRYGLLVYLAIPPLFAVALSAQFFALHQTNVGYVYEQPYQMANWLRQNTPPDAVVAVHDVGLMRYLGERTTLDMVGLTTPGAAVYWRNGPGSVAEFLLREQPDYIASYGYGHGYGLAYLADTAIFGEPLALFAIPNWQRERNVALAADVQGIYQSDWAALVPQHQAANCAAEPENVIWSLQVADLASEARAQYAWDTVLSQGFVTEVRQVGAVVDGYRLLNGAEAFTPDVPQPYTDADLLLSTRVHPQYAGRLNLFINDEPLATRWIPEMPGEWLHIETRIPAHHVSSDMRIRIVPEIEDGYYMPACHALTPYASAEAPQPADAPLALYQDRAFALEMLEICANCEPGQLLVDMRFRAQSSPRGDYRFFLHLYDDVTQPPLVQWDGYFDGVPVGNWLPGTHEQQIALDTTQLAPGTYQLALGFYNPGDPTDRLLPTSDLYDVAADGRLWLGEVVVGE